MYKIFISDKPFIIAPSTNSFEKGHGSLLIARSELYNMKQAIDLISLNAVSNLTITGDVETIWQEFLQQYKLIDAAGGVVINNENKVLFIFRLGKWDLPKGKVDEGETFEQAALREVEEECGIGKLSLTGKLLTTYHTYTLKGQNILKASHWYSMTTADNTEPKPQTEENITNARWVSADEIPALLKDAYPSIAEVINKYFNK
ncbi:MAG: RNA pyrophosphohydrolase [Bacteroidia bacterium]|nr:RNA pyrophosphohydrolase [Bacteroidia bacterium]